MRLFFWWSWRVLEPLKFFARQTAKAFDSAKQGKLTSPLGLLALSGPVHRNKLPLKKASSTDETLFLVELAGTEPASIW